MTDMTEAYSALQAADAAGNSDDAKQLADYIRSQSSQTSTDTGTDYGRQASIVGRSASQGVVNALTLPNTIMTGARNTPAFIANKLFGGNFPYQKTIGQQYSDAMTKAGAAVPKTSGEQLEAAGVSGLTGALGGAGAGGITGAANILRAGSAGVTGSLSQETAHQMGLPFWMQIGAGILGSQAPALGESVTRTLSDLVAPLTSSGQQRAVGTLFNQQARDPAKALENLQASAPIVPNSYPTSGAASQDVGLLGIEKYARGANAPAFGERLSEQNLARQNELGSIAGTPNDLNAAIAARGNTTNPLYAAAATQSAPIDNEMIALMQRPAMQAAIAKAKELAENSGRTFGMSAPGGPLSLTGQDLQGVRMALDDMHSTAFTQGIGSHQARAIQGTTDALKDWMQRNVPAQRQADAAYQNLSTPINRMQTLQDFQQKANLTAADAGTGQYFLSPSGFNRGLAAIKDDPFSGVTPGDTTRLSAILKDLESSQAVNGPLLKAPGSDTFQNLSLRQNLGGLAGFAGKPLDVLYNLAGSDKAINALLSKAMLDPKFAASLMQQAAASRGGLNFRPYDMGAFGGFLGSQSATR